MFDDNVTSEDPEHDADLASDADLQAELEADLANVFKQQNADDDSEEQAEYDGDQPTSLLDELAKDDEAPDEDAVDDQGTEEAPAQAEAESESETEAPLENEPTDIPSLRKAFRESQKALKQAQRDLEQSIEQRQAVQDFNSSASMQKPDPLVAESAEYTTEQLVAYLGRVEAGDRNTNPDFRAKALQLLEYKNPQEIVDVIRKARTGAFGDVSRDVELVGQEAIPLVQAVTAQRQQEVANQNAWHTTNRAALQQVLDSGVAFTNDGKLDMSNESSVEYSKCGQELMTALPSLSREARAPAVVLEYMNLKRQAARAEQVPALEARIAELEQKLSTQSAPLPSSDAPASRPQDNDEDELRAAFRAAGIGALA